MSNFIDVDISLGDPFWLNDIKILFQSNRITEFLPNNDMTYNEKLNSIMRFSIYLSVILFLYKDNYLVFYIVIFIGLFTYLLYDNNKKIVTKEKFNSKDIQNTKKENVLNLTDNECQKPSYNNPFMNVLQTDIKYRPQRPPACNNSDETIKKDINNKFNVNLYRYFRYIWKNKLSKTILYNAFYHYTE